MEGIIFDVKEFTLHDGPGLRTTVFLKGCPLRCRWCHNPEGMAFKPEVITRGSCSKCGACEMTCDHAQCKPFKKCVRRCPNNALSICGESIDATVLSKRLKRQSSLLIDGGITLSGGEPLAQPEFTLELLRLLHPLHTVVESCGYADHEVFKAAINSCDLILFDLKIVNSANHIKWTGKDNRIILDNLKILASSTRKFILRVPLIPGITDTIENLNDIANAIKDYKNMAMVELLPYNPFSAAKYSWVLKEYQLTPLTPQTEFNSLTEIFKNKGIPCKVLM